jgi:diguanylate cyclase (GGDEF)-like protein
VAESETPAPPPPKTPPKPAPPAERPRDSVRRFVEEELIQLTGLVTQDVIEAAARDVERSKQLDELLLRARRDTAASFYSNLLFTLTHLKYPESQARDLWDKLLEHKWHLSERLGRNVGIAVAAADYFRNILGVLEDVKIMDASQYIETAQLAITDGLTGVFNHRHFQDRLARDLARAKQENLRLTLLMADLDHFKLYNDINGHVAGDVALKEVGNVIRQNLKRDDLVARYGGEEFAVILVGLDRAEALPVAERLRKVVENCSLPNQRVLPEGRLTISIGLAEYPSDAKDRSGLIAAADRALYIAKRSGRNRVALAPSDQRRETRCAVALPARYRASETSEAPWLEGRTLNLSGGGLCLLTASQWPLGRVLELRLQPLDELPLLARVVWQSVRGGPPYQTGLKFINLSQEAMEKLDLLLKV